MDFDFSYFYIIKFHHKVLNFFVVHLKETDETNN